MSFVEVLGCVDVSHSNPFGMLMKKERKKGALSTQPTPGLCMKNLVASIICIHA